jgi:two-component system sensor histidine kinase KdpD
LLSVAVFEVVFVIPRIGFSTRDVQYLLTFSGLLLVGWIISNLAAVARDQVSASQRREAHNTALNLFSRELTVALGVDDVLNVILQQVSRTFSREVVIFLSENNMPRLRASSTNMQLGVEELKAIHWAFDHGESAGRGTDTLPDSKLRAMPLLTSRGTVGVIGVMPPDPTSYLEPEQRRLLESFVSLSALAVERAILAEQASQSHVLQAAERLQTALLNSISHDLRSPLASITGVLSSLKESGSPGNDHVRLDEATQADMVDTALGEAGRLNRLVANLLDMTRLEAGALHLKIEPCDLQDLIGVSLSRLGDRLERHFVRTTIPSGLPLIPLDFVMMSQAIGNLLDNAIKYSPPGTQIEIIVEPQAGQVLISVADEGIGIPPEDLEKVFDKFYRVQRKVTPPGTGLGLAIARGIVEAHNGRIWAENRPQGGVIIKITLPAPAVDLAIGEREKAVG